MSGTGRAVHARRLTSQRLAGPPATSVLSLAALRGHIVRGPVLLGAPSAGQPVPPEAAAALENDARAVETFLG